MVGRKGASGRRFGVRSLKVRKIQSNITMTPEAWAILAKNAYFLAHRREAPRCTR